MPLNDSQWNTLAAQLQHSVAAVAPDWTDSNTHDPGITTLEALAWVVGELHARRPPWDERARALAHRVADATRALADSMPLASTGDCGAGLQRVNFVAGRVLDIEDFQTLQDHARLRLNRRNRLLHGAGVATGLAVTLEREAGGSRVVIGPGLAYDRAGQEIAVETPSSIGLPAPGLIGVGSIQWVLLSHRERPCRPVPVLAADPTAATTAPTRIVEDFEAVLATEPAEPALAIARLRLTRGRWRIDPTFEALRARA